MEGIENFDPSMVGACDPFDHKWREHESGDAVKLIINIVGPIGAGKTTIAWLLQRILAEDGRPTVYSGELMLEGMLAETYRDGVNQAINRLLLDTTLLALRIRLMFDILRELNEERYLVAIVERPYYETAIFNPKLSGICDEATLLINERANSTGIRIITINVETDEDTCMERATDRDSEFFESKEFEDVAYLHNLKATHWMYTTRRTSLFKDQPRIHSISGVQSEDNMIKRLEEILMRELN